MKESAVEKRPRARYRPAVVAARFASAMQAFFVAPMRAPRHSAHVGWTPAMTRLALCFLVAGLVLAFFDAVAIERIRDNRSFFAAFLARITDLGKSEWYLVPSAVIVLGLAVLDWHRSGARNKARLAFVFAQAGYAFAAVALTGILVNILKLFIGRGRPVLFDQGGAFQFQPFDVQYAYLSFPSGHATTCGALAMILILWFPRWWPAIAAWAFAIAMSRVAAQAHYPSDVVVGFGLGLLYALWLARWLAVRGAAFRIHGGRLLPAMRHARAWSRALRKR